MSTVITIVGALVIIGFVVKAFVQKPSSPKSGTTTSGSGHVTTPTTDDNTKFQI